MTTFIENPNLSPANRADVFRAQIDHLYLQLPRLLAFSLLVSLLLSAMLREAVAAGQIIGWLLTMIVVLLVRLVLYFCYKRASDQRQAVGTTGADPVGIGWNGRGISLCATDVSASVLCLFTRFDDSGRRHDDLARGQFPYIHGGV
jgi:hypothetical protein